MDTIKIITSMIGRREIRARSECELLVFYNIIIRFYKKNLRAEWSVVVVGVEVIIMRIVKIIVVVIFVVIIRVILVIKILLIVVVVIKTTSNIGKTSSTSFVSEPAF